MEAEGRERQAEACCGDENNDEAQEPSANQPPRPKRFLGLLERHAPTLRAAVECGQVERLR